MQIDIYVPDSKHFKVKKEDVLCKNCKHFYQHYIFYRGFYRWTNAGHCAYPRVKSKEPNDTCKHFERR